MYMYMFSVHVLLRLSILQTNQLISRYTYVEVQANPRIFAAAIVRQTHRHAGPHVEGKIQFKLSNFGLSAKYNKYKYNTYNNKKKN